MKKFNWVILGAGSIGNVMAEALNAVNGEIYGVVNRSLDKAVAFAEKHGVSKVFTSADQMFADELVDIVYIATPHNSHYDYLKKAIAQGKHVLCEKAITVNAQQLEDVISLAEAKNVVVAEAMTIFHMPLYKRLNELVESGVIGDVKMVQVNFGSYREHDVNSRFLSKHLAGGALLDIGVYAVAFARYFLKSKPDVVLTTASYFDTGTDEQSGIIMKNREGQMVVTALTLRAKQPKRGVVAGEKGFIEIDNYPRAERATITYTEDGHKEVIEIGETQRALEYEVEDFQLEVANRGNGQDRMDLTVDVTDLLQTIRNSWGMVYPFE